MSPGETSQATRKRRRVPLETPRPPSCLIPLFGSRYLIREGSRNHNPIHPIPTFKHPESPATWRQKRCYTSNNPTTARWRPDVRSKSFRLRGAQVFRITIPTNHPVVAKTVRSTLRNQNPGETRCLAACRCSCGSCRGPAKARPCKIPD